MQDTVFLANNLENLRNLGIVSTCYSNDGLCGTVTQIYLNFNNLWSYFTKVLHM